VNNESLTSDFLAAKAKTSVTIMNATGWQEGVVNPVALGVDSVFFYVFDHQTQWTWCCSIPLESFYAVVDQSKAGSESAYVAGCGQMIAECAAAGNGVKPDMENELAISLSAYISITKSYQLTEAATKQNHFAVIRYGLTKMIRPFVLDGPPRHLIPARFIREAMMKVVAIDSKNHPDWIV
jgi:hypothetical protein